MDNTINLQITVNDEELKELIKGNLKNLPEEKIQEIFSSALIQILTSEDGKRLFVEKGRYYDDRPKPTLLLQNMINNAVEKDLIVPVVNEFVKSISDEFENIIRDCIIKTFSEVLMTDLKSSVIENKLYNVIDSINNNH